MAFEAVVVEAQGAVLARGKRCPQYAIVFSAPPGGPCVFKGHQRTMGEELVKRVNENVARNQKRQNDDK